MLAIDHGDLTVLILILILMDLATTFDTVDHDILLQRLQMSFEIKTVAIQWFQS